MAAARKTQKKKALPMKPTIKSEATDATRIVAAAAGLATIQVSDAAVSATKTLATSADAAGVVIAAAASLATTQVAVAAADASKTLAVSADAAGKTIAIAAHDAVKTLATAATAAATVVTDRADKALAEFPDLKTDIREIREAQRADVGQTTEMVKTLLEAHTHAEEAKLTSIDRTVQNVEVAVTAVEAHMVHQNGRLATAETHITRMNLIIFGIAGPISLAVGGYYVKTLIGMLIAAQHSGSPMPSWELILGATIVGETVLLGVLGFLAHRLYKRWKARIARAAAVVPDLAKRLGEEPAPK